MEIPTKMDDDWGTPHDLGNLQLISKRSNFVAEDGTRHRRILGCGVDPGGSQAQVLRQTEREIGHISHR